jgi:hypothetical protein
MLPEDECDIKEEWNQASFAAFLTYEESQDFLKNIQINRNLDLKDYLIWLQTEHKIFKSQTEVKTFTEYLKMKSKEQNAPYITD